MIGVFVGFSLLWMLLRVRHGFPPLAVFETDSGERGR
jgi:hypothetical protein